MDEAMERGAATQGQVALQMVGAEAIEIKATVPDHQIRQALERTNNNKGQAASLLNVKRTTLVEKIKRLQP